MNIDGLPSWNYHLKGEVLLETEVGVPPAGAFGHSVFDSASP